MPNLASQFLDNVKWQKLFAQHIKGMKNIESMKLDSDALLDILRRRLDSPYEAHKMENLREHSCFQWASYSLPRVCSAMVYASHIKENHRSKRVTPSTTLLGNPYTSKLSNPCNAREENYKNLHGCYLYHNQNQGNGHAAGRQVEMVRQRLNQETKNTQRLQRNCVKASST